MSLSWTPDKVYCEVLSLLDSISLRKQLFEVRADWETKVNNWSSAPIFVLPFTQVQKEVNQFIKTIENLQKSEITYLEVVKRNYIINANPCLHSCLPVCLPAVCLSAYVLACLSACITARNKLNPRFHDYHSNCIWLHLLSCPCRSSPNFPKWENQKVRG